MARSCSRRYTRRCESEKVDFDILAQLLLQLRDFRLARHAFLHQADAFEDIGFLQQRLLVRHVDAEIARDQVRELPGIVDVHQHQPRLFGHVWRHFQQVNGRFAQVIDRRDGLGIGRSAGIDEQRFHSRAQEWFRLDDLAQVEAARGLHEQHDRAVRLAHQLEHLAGDADRIYRSSGRRFLVLLGALRHQADGFRLCGSDSSTSLSALGRPKRKGHDGARENHDAADGQDRQFGGDDPARPRRRSWTVTAITGGASAVGGWLSGGVSVTDLVIMERGEEEGKVEPAGGCPRAFLLNRAAGEGG